MAASERLGAALRAAVVRLTAAGIEAPRVDAEWLAAAALHPNRARGRAPSTTSSAAARGTSTAGFPASDNP